MLNRLKPKINTGDILPEIVSTLQRFEYKGLTDQNDPINQIGMDIMRDDFNKVMLGKPYLNIYRFGVNGSQYYLCDRAVITSVEVRRHMCILAAEKSIPLGFEITTNTNDEFINNDCESVEIIRGCDVRVEEPDEYEGQKDVLITVLPHCEHFSTDSYPVAFFSFPEDHMLGYHVSGRLITSDEVESAISLLQEFS
jgi:hypothetical protein